MARNKNATKFTELVCLTFDIVCIEIQNSLTKILLGFPLMHPCLFICLRIF